MGEATKCSESIARVSLALACGPKAVGPREVYEREDISQWPSTAIRARASRPHADVRSATSRVASYRFSVIESKRHGPKISLAEIAGNKTFAEAQRVETSGHRRAN